MRALIALAPFAALMIAGAPAPVAALEPQARTAAPAAPPASRDPRVKFKDGARYLADLAEGLEIPREEICRELSRYDCNDEAFLIVLGGVEPYEVRVMEPLEHASLAAPIAFDRVAMHACVNRVERDLSAPAQAVLLKPLRGRGRAAERTWMEAAAKEIYGRVLRRDATPAEVSRLTGFYQDVAAGRRDSADARRKDWVVLSCFSVASSLEAAFY